MELRSSSFNTLRNLVAKKDKLQKPVREGVARTGEMLTSPAAKKILAYLFEQNESKVEELSQDPERKEFIEKIKKAFISKEPLEVEDSLKIDNLFIDLLQKIPIAKSEKGGSILYKEIAEKTRCKIEDVKKIMDAFIGPGLEEWFKKINKKN